MLQSVAGPGAPLRASRPGNVRRLLPVDRFRHRTGSFCKFATIRCDCQEGIISLTRKFSQCSALPDATLDILPLSRSYFLQNSLICVTDSS